MVLCCAALLLAGQLLTLVKQPSLLIRKLMNVPPVVYFGQSQSLSLVPRWCDLMRVFKRGGGTIWTACCYAMLCYAMLCYAMLCYAMLCYTMLCYAMLHYAMKLILILALIPNMRQETKDEIQNDETTLGNLAVSFSWSTTTPFDCTLASEEQHFHDAHRYI
jgi:hypothetical protein